MEPEGGHPFVNAIRRLKDRFILRVREIDCDCTCTCSRRCWRSALKKNAFLIALIIAVIIGIALGIGLRDKKTPWTPKEKNYLKFPGDLFLRMLKMMILPLVISSIISGMSSLSRQSSGRIGARTVIYYMTTTFTSVVLGIILVVIIQPGSGGEDINRRGKSKNVSPLDALMDLIRNCFPSNIITASFERTLTIFKTSVIAANNSEPNETSSSVNLVSPDVTTARESNILGLIVFCILFSLALNSLGPNGDSVRSFFDGVNETILVIVRWLIWYTPIGIIFLLAYKIVDMQDPITVLAQLGKYIATVAVGLAIHTFLILPLLYLIFVKKNPYAYLLGMAEALLTALATASSSATLPVTLHCAEDINRINKRITRFVLPLGATINMDGTALYEAVASIFIAQVNKVTLDFGQIIIVSLTSTAAAIGAAGVPEAGLVTMVIVLEAVGLPTEDITLILAIDWFLDRLRTTTNVWGDAVGAAVIEKLSKADLEPQPERDEPHVYEQDVDLEGENVELEEVVVNDDYAEA